MDSSSSEITHDFRPFFRVHKSGRIERFHTPHVPPSTDPSTGVQSKDVLISPHPKISARIYVPHQPNSKLPLLIYFHGGAFSSESAFSTLYHTYLNSLVAAANVVAVSIEYRLAPENPIPACYDDSWTALKWVALHTTRTGPDSWVNNHADFNRVFLMGDSSGGNIAHNMAVRAGMEELDRNMRIVGMILIHPLFGNYKHEKLWNYICPDTSAEDDSRYNPGLNPTLLSRIVCNKILITSASKDVLRERGWIYYGALKKSEWIGDVEMVETQDEKHVFHLYKNNSENSRRLMRLVASFINHNYLFKSSL